MFGSVKKLYLYYMYIFMIISLFVWIEEKKNKTKMTWEK